MSLAQSISLNHLSSTANCVSSKCKIINRIMCYLKRVSLSNTVSAGIFTGIRRSGCESKCIKLTLLSGRCFEPMARYIKGRTCKRHMHAFRTGTETMSLHLSAASKTMLNATAHNLKHTMLLTSG